MRNKRRGNPYFNGREYNNSFKAVLVADVMSGTHTIASAARAHDVVRKTSADWVKRARAVAAATAATSTAGPTRPKRPSAKKTRKATTVKTSARKTTTK